MKLEMELLKEKLAVIKLSINAPIPEWVWGSKIYSVTKTEDELSVIVEQSFITDDTAVESDWYVFRIKGEYPISLVGLVSYISGILSKHNISIFPLSTYGTDYYLVKESDVVKAFNALKDANISVSEEF